MELPPGTMLAGRYRVDRVVGRGGMGLVVAATHVGLDERVAIKVLTQDSKQDQETMERFSREARAAAKIKSEHVARVSDVGVLDDGSPFLVMEFLAGKDLSLYLRERGQLSIAEAVDFVLQACDGVAEAHALGIVHRDLKPSNLFLTRRSDGSALVKVLDFGVSKLVGAEFGPALTRTNDVVGSPVYMPPEQMTSSKNVDLRADIWALGIILYELVTGTLPFVADSFAALCSQVMKLEPPPMAMRRFDVPAGLEAVVLCCLAKNPAQRFQTLGALAQAIAPFAPASSHHLVDRVVRTAGLSMETRRGTELSGETDSAAPTRANPPSTLGFAPTHVTPRTNPPSTEGLAPTQVTPGRTAIPTDTTIPSTPRPVMMPEPRTLASPNREPVTPPARPQAPIPQPTEAAWTTPRIIAVLALATVVLSVVVALAIKLVVGRSDAPPRPTALAPTTPTTSASVVPTSAASAASAPVITASASAAPSSSAPPKHLVAPHVSASPKVDDDYGSRQ